MDEKEAIESTARQLILFAGERGIDIASHFRAETFWSEDYKREIIFKWIDGELFFRLSGEVAALPMRLKTIATNSDFTGVYTENGCVSNLEGAYLLLKSWVLDRKEVDDLPARISDKLGAVE